MYSIQKALDIVAKKYTDRHGYSVYGINDGDCENFAMDVIDLLGGESDNLYLEWFDNYMRDPAPAHCFIVYNSKFYDCETPEGVNDLKDLLFYERWVKEWINFYGILFIDRISKLRRNMYKRKLKKIFRSYKHEQEEA